MAINKDDLDMAKWILDQAIYHRDVMSLQDTMTIRAFLSALDEHKDRPGENVKSQEWRAMVYRKLLDDPQALMQFTQAAMEKFSPEQISMMLHPQVQEAVIRRHRLSHSHGEDVDLNEALSEMDDGDLYELLRSEGRLTDLVDYYIDNEPDYVRERLGLGDDYEEEVRAEGYESGQEHGQEAGYSVGYEEGHERGYETGHAQGLKDAL